VKAPLSWLRDFAPLPDAPADVAARLAGCGFEVASLDGDVIDVEVTANRPDCLSVYGLAREAAAAFEVPLAPAPGVGLVAPATGSTLPVSIADPGCGRYALAVATVRVGPSPAWLAERLQAAGVRPINNVVDVTNYVMLETGHPMHAFDAATLAGPRIEVRRARPAERLVTLDGQQRTLDETMLVIADQARPVALAGVMGGAETEVSATTTRVALESAWFQPAAVRAMGRRLLLKTEASARFERGADLAAPPRAMARALALLAETGAGDAAGPIVDVCPEQPQPRQVRLRRTRLAHLLGDVVPDGDVVRVLTALGFGVDATTDGWTIVVPSFRVDVHREVDLIEEVGRHWGFDRLPVTFPALETMPRPSAAGVDTGRKLRRVLCGAGLQEAATFTFIEREAAEPFVADAAALVPIANPLSEKFAVLRPSLLPGLLDALVYNRRREQESVRLFEIGAAFSNAGERSRISWLMTGSRHDHWSERPVPLDFFDAKGVAELVAAGFGIALDASPADDRPWFVRGRSARLTAAGAHGAIEVGSVGQIRPEIAARRGLGQADAVTGGELDLAALDALRAPDAERIVPLPRHPSIVRDLSILVDARLPAADVRGTIRAIAPPTLVAVREFDRYQGKGVPDGSISLSLRLTFRAADRTLTDAEVQVAVDAVVAALAKAHGATLRGAAGSTAGE